MNTGFAACILGLGAALLAGCGQNGGREVIRIVGSSTVFPFSTAVAEHFGAMTAFPTPVVESTGSGGGLKLFCAGIGEATPDIANSSRRIKRSEWELCRRNGVTEILEFKIGFDGIVIANAVGAPQLELTKRQIFLALAKDVPAGDDDCTLTPNPYETWSAIDPALPDQTIEVFGPPPTSGTRDAFVEIAMRGGALQIACLADLEAADEDGFEAVAYTIREDGLWIDAGENDNSIIQTILQTPTAVGVFGFSFLDQNADQIQAASVGGVAPTLPNIAAGGYGISRSLYFYAKRQHIGVIPGVAQFVRAFANADASGEFGYLIDKGLIPLQDAERRTFLAKAEELAPLLDGSDL